MERRGGGKGMGDERGMVEGQLMMMMMMVVMMRALKTTH